MLLPNARSLSGTIARPEWLFSGRRSVAGLDRAAGRRLAFAAVRTATQPADTRAGRRAAPKSGHNDIFGHGIAIFKRPVSIVRMPTRARPSLGLLVRKRTAQSSKRQFNFGLLLKCDK
jgi:hypothetical protein